MKWKHWLCGREGNCNINDSKEPNLNLSSVKKNKNKYKPTKKICISL